MELAHIKIEDLKTTSLNVRKVGAKNVDDLIASIRTMGVLQPLLVRPNCEGFEVVAGQRRFYAVQKLAEEGIVEPLPCLIMDGEDDVKAIEASLAENIERLPMDEIDQYKAFSALMKNGQSVENIATHFGITERLVNQRLAISNLLPPILTAYRKEELDSQSLKHLTMATKKQQKEWLKLYNDEDNYAPTRHQLKSWLFGGAELLVSNAIFNLADYDGDIISDLFGDDQYFGDSVKFWEMQNTAIANAKQTFLDNGWNKVEVLNVGESWYKWSFVETTKKNGGAVYIEISNEGEVTFNKGFVSEEEAESLNGSDVEGDEPQIAQKPELTQPMQNYIELHRHSSVRTELLNHRGIALRIAVAQMIAGSDLWSVDADRQKGATEAITASLTENKAEAEFNEARKAIRGLMKCSEDENATFVRRKGDWGNSHDLYEIFATLQELSDEAVMTVLIFVTAETLPCGSWMVEDLGEMLQVDLSKDWSPDDTFLALMRDKEVLNEMVTEVAGKEVADANISATVKVKKQIIGDCLSGNRTSKVEKWTPKYMQFPYGTYTDRGGISVIHQFKTAKSI